MVVFTVQAMVAYNINLSKGWLTDGTLLNFLDKLPLMGTIGFLVEIVT